MALLHIWRISLLFPWPLFFFPPFFICCHLERGKNNKYLVRTKASSVRPELILGKCGQSRERENIKASQGSLSSRGGLFLLSLFDHMASIISSSNTRCDHLAKKRFVFFFFLLSECSHVFWQRGWNRSNGQMIE